MVVIDYYALDTLLLKRRGWRKVRDILWRMKPLFSPSSLLRDVAKGIIDAVADGRITDRQARMLFQAFMEVIETGVIVLVNDKEIIRDAFLVSLDTGLPISDALYLALAKVKDGLVTSNESLASMAEKLGVRVFLVS